METRHLQVRAPHEAGHALPMQLKVTPAVNALGAQPPPIATVSVSSRLPDRKREAVTSRYVET